MNFIVAKRKLSFTRMHSVLFNVQDCTKIESFTR